ncbi:MAG: ribose 5-phosphate isomerase B [Nanoarchaeota archaeon]|nr:ribose 5-phosphate isomerase B [Nanoarchaeota archaeon]MCG2718224.1 ribose 5-phosphate isomerase B [Nanoarchaeota archaeon]
MKIALGSDHGGYDLKEYLKKYLDEEGIEYGDVGTFSKDSCDYPDFGEKVAMKVSYWGYDYGLLVCTTGQGMAMTANKVGGIRAALCYKVDMAKMSRLHNNANVIVFGAKYTRKGLAKKILKTFLETEFEGGRHEKRVDKIKCIEDRVL